MSQSHEIVAGFQKNRLDPAALRLVDEVEPVDLPAARAWVQQQHEAIPTPRADDPRGRYWHRLAIRAGRPAEGDPRCRAEHGQRNRQRNQLVNSSAAHKFRRAGTESSDHHDDCERSHHATTREGEPPGGADHSEHGKRLTQGDDVADEQDDERDCNSNPGNKGDPGRQPATTHGVIAFVRGSLS
jgi:hypothetical protein